jgi:VanZ family protein
MNQEPAMGRKATEGGVNEYQLALLSRSVFDIGPRTRLLVLIFGLKGVALALMESLVSGQQVPLDKMIHFAGYFTLAMTFVLALRPMLFVPGLAGLVAMGIAIEFLQRYTGRSFDMMDAYANTLGVVVGGLAGLIIRGIYAFIRKEAAARRVQKNLLSFRADETMLREGDPIDDMYIIKQGRVRIMRDIDGRDVDIAEGSAGDVVGVLGVVEGKPQYATIRALEPTVVYRISMRELMESAGGDQLPVSLVLTGLCERLRSLADQLAGAGRAMRADQTMA